MSETKKLAELKARQHQHDVTIKTFAGTRTISDKEWFNILTNEDATKKPPEFTLTGAVALSSLLTAAEGEKLTRQYGTDNEAHFGFTKRPITVIAKIEEVFSAIDKLTFTAATHGECEQFDMTTELGKYFIGNDVEDIVVRVNVLERLNWMFSRVKFLCGDMLRDVADPECSFYLVTSEKNGVAIGDWLVTANYITKVFGDDGVITISDDGMIIKLTPTVPTPGQLYSQDGDFRLTSFYDAIENAVTGYFYHANN